MFQSARRRFLTTVAAASVTAALAQNPTRGERVEAPTAAVPMLHVTDLFRPHNDPDDHWDLACAYALAYQGRAELKGVLIDFPPPGPPRDPDVMAVAQMNYLTGLLAPVLVGSPRVIAPEDAGTAAAQADLRGIRTLLDILRRSPQPVVISILGSTRDVALAGKLEPQLFATKCAGIYLNAGSGTPDKAKAARLEYNVALDPASYAAIFQLPCPVYWMPCFEDAGEFRVAEYGTFYQFRQADVLPHLSDRVQNYFGLMYKHGGVVSGPPWNWLQYLIGPKEAPLLAQQGAQFRNMWCTAGFLHAVGLTVARDGKILPRGEAADAVFSFDPIRITCAPNGVTEWTSDATAKERYIFHVRDRQNYQAAMTTALQSLLLTLP
ncbi:MAG: hypothetical protein NTY19_35270 [Planctomycetota bacterium]|nr:hypothetical protein [Planctomycetota bacterium]